MALLFDRLDRRPDRIFMRPKAQHRKSITIAATRDRALPAAGWLMRLVGSIIRCGFTIGEIVIAVKSRKVCLMLWLISRSGDKPDPAECYCKLRPVFRD